MIRVSIPSHHKVVEDNNDSYTVKLIPARFAAASSRRHLHDVDQSKFLAWTSLSGIKVFTIEVCIVSTGKTTIVQKRYSEFEMLHKQLKKQMKTPEFPPKKMMKFSNKVLEQRRLALQTYLQGVASMDKTPKLLLLFLDVEQYISGSQDSLDQLDYSNRTTHQPMIAFPPEVYLQDSNRNGSWDIVNAGVLSALYNNVDDLLVR